MAFDVHKNLAVASVVTPPAPATSGTSLVVGAGLGARFPAVPFNATVWPIDMAPDPATAEVVRVTARATDTLTITRAQESTTARAIVAGDFIAATITAKSLTDIEAGTNFPLITTPGTVTTPALASAAGSITFSPAATLRGTMHASGGFSWGGIVDPGAGHLSVTGDVFEKTRTGAMGHWITNNALLPAGTTGAYKYALVGKTLHLLVTATHPSMPTTPPLALTLPMTLAADSVTVLVALYQGTWGIGIGSCGGGGALMQIYPTGAAFTGGNTIIGVAVALAIA